MTTKKKKPTQLDRIEQSISALAIDTALKLDRIDARLNTNGGMPDPVSSGTPPPKEELFKVGDWVVAERGAGGAGAGWKPNEPRRVHALDTFHSDPTIMEGGNEYWFKPHNLRHATPSEIKEEQQRLEIKGLLGLTQGCWAENHGSVEWEPRNEVKLQCLGGVRRAKNDLEWPEFLRRAKGTAERLKKERLEEEARKPLDFGVPVKLSQHVQDDDRSLYGLDFFVSCPWPNSHKQFCLVTNYLGTPLQ